MFSHYFAFGLALTFAANACLASSLYGGAAPNNYYGDGGVDVIARPDNAQAQAAALTRAASAKASAAKINNMNWRALDLYGHEIGRPLLVQEYGQLTNLYAAALPPTSFVGKTDPAFVKDVNGKIKFVGESSIGVVAI